MRFPSKSLVVWGVAQHCPFLYGMTFQAVKGGGPWWELGSKRGG